MDVVDEEGKGLVPRDQGEGFADESSVCEGIWRWLNKGGGFLVGLAMFCAGGLQWYEWDRINSSNFQVLLCSVCHISVFGSFYIVL